MSFLTTFPDDVYPTHALAPLLRPGAFSIARAQALMWLAQAAYETTAGSPGKLERLLAPWGLVPRARLSAGGTEGFVAETDAALVVAFAGTDPVVAANWMTDFDIRIGPDGLHRGFVGGVDSIWTGLTGALSGVTKPLFLTGHSLGGALAVVAAARLADATISPGGIAAVTTFGAPRVGNDGFAAAYRAAGLWHRTVRLHHGADLVPMLPPTVTGRLPFHDIGLALRCPHGGRFADVMPPTEQPDPLPDWTTLRDGWRLLLRHGIPSHPAGGPAGLLIDSLPVFLRDHLQDCYLEALGWTFTRPSDSRLSISTADADAFLRAGQDALAHSGRRLSSLLNRFRP